MPFGLWTWVGQRNRVLDGVQILPWEAAILMGKGRPIVEYREYRPCVAAMRPFVKYFEHLLLLLIN